MQELDLIEDDYFVVVRAVGLVDEEGLVVVVVVLQVLGVFVHQILELRTPSLQGKECLEIGPGYSYLVHIAVVGIFLQFHEIQLVNSMQEGFVQSGN